MILLQAISYAAVCLALTVFVFGVFVVGIVIAAGSFRRRN